MAKCQIQEAIERAQGEGEEKEEKDADGEFESRPEKQGRAEGRPPYNDCKVLFWVG